MGLCTESLGLFLWTETADFTHVYIHQSSSFALTSNSNHIEPYPLQTSFMMGLTCPHRFHSYGFLSLTSASTHHVRPVVLVRVVTEDCDYEKCD